MPRVTCSPCLSKMNSLNLRPRDGRQLPRRIVVFASPRSSSKLGWRIVMKRLVPIPCECAEHLKGAEETGIGYQVVSVQLKDERVFEQVVISEGCIIEVRGYKEIPFTPDEVVSVCACRLFAARGLAQAFPAVLRRSCNKISNRPRCLFGS